MSGAEIWELKRRVEVLEQSNREYERGIVAGDDAGLDSWGVPWLRRSRGPRIRSRGRSRARSSYSATRAG